MFRRSVLSLRMATQFRLVMFVKTVILMSVGVASASAHAATLFLRGAPYTIQISQQFSEVPILRFANGAIAKVHAAVVYGYSGDEVPEIADCIRKRHWIEIKAVLCETLSPAKALELSQLEASRFRFIHPDLQFATEARQTEEPFFAAQWNLPVIGVPEYWTTTRGSPDTIVAVLDLGFEQEHEDLKQAWWINPREIPNNRIDDDNNGKRDDISGWNFSIDGPNLLYGQNSKHGTASAGIIGARLNGKGVVGICPQCRLLPIVISGRVSEDADAILYAVRMGAKILSNSWGYALESPLTDVVSEALQYVGERVPTIFAMHNAAVDDCRASALDISGHPAVIAVSSVDRDLRKVASSGYGSCLAFVAPSSANDSDGIPTTDRMGTAGYNSNGQNNFADLNYHSRFWGTSAAAPQVAGAMALYLSAYPDTSRDLLIETFRQRALKVHPNDAAYDASGHSLLYGFGVLRL